MSDRRPEFTGDDTRQVCKSDFQQKKTYPKPLLEHLLNTLNQKPKFFVSS